MWRRGWPAGVRWSRCPHGPPCRSPPSTARAPARKTSMRMLDRHSERDRERGRWDRRGLERGAEVVAEAAKEEWMTSCLWYGISWSPEGLVALVMLARLVACCRCRTKFTQAVDNFLLQMQAPLGFSNKLSMNMGHASLLDQADILHFVCLSPVLEDHRLACNSRIVYHLAINSSGANLVNPTGRKPQS